MNVVFEAKNPRNGWHHARADRDHRNAEHLDPIEALKVLQAQHPRSSRGCSEAFALTLATLAFWEGKR